MRFDQIISTTIYEKEPVNYIREFYGGKRKNQSYCNT